MLKKLLFLLFIALNSYAFAYTCPPTDLRAELQTKIDKLKEANLFIEKAIQESSGEQIKNSVISGLFITLQTADFATNFISFEKQGMRILVDEFKGQVKIVSTALSNGEVTKEILNHSLNSWSNISGSKALNRVNYIYQGYQLISQSWEIFEETSSINKNIEAMKKLSNKFKSKIEKQILALEDELATINEKCY